MSNTHPPSPSSVEIPAPQAALGNQQPPKIEIDFLEAGGLTLRRMVVRGPRSNGTVLLLHGFPESVHAWKDIALSLGRDYEVHAFDWPGYGLSTRPDSGAFSYSPKDYARILAAYIEAAGIDKTGLVIYATDLGGMPALLLALETSDAAKGLIVGDFSPFDRIDYLSPNLKALKAPSSAEVVRTTMNESRDELLKNIFTRGLPEEARFEVPQELRDDIAHAWEHGGMTSADALYHYYSHFSRDQQYLESNLARLMTPVRVIWGEKDVFINKDMGVEFAGKANVPISVLIDIGHYPHLQTPARVIAEIRAAFSSFTPHDR